MPTNREDQVLNEEEPSPSMIRDCVVSIPRPILQKFCNRKVVRASIIHGEQMATTSKIHTFKPSVEIPIAVAWLLKNKSIDGAIIFDNESSITFLGGKFHQLIEV